MDVGSIRMAPLLIKAKCKLSWDCVFDPVEFSWRIRGRIWIIKLFWSLFVFPGGVKCKIKIAFKADSVVLNQQFYGVYNV